jgi:valyl-tRNA synthetase
MQLSNKLWNAARLILLGVGAGGGAAGTEIRAAVEPAAVEDRWILSRLERARAEVGGRIERYDFSHAALALYDFVYGELCDWYLELVKPRLRDGEPALAATLLHVLTETVALAHPVIPFVTEEIYSYIPGADGLLAARVDPGGDAGLIDEGVEQALGRMTEAVQAVRGWRDSSAVPPRAVLPARLRAERYEETAEHLARLGRLAWSDDAGAEPVAVIPVPGGTIEILASDELDADAAAARVAAQRSKLAAEIKRSGAKLANAGFVAKAPPEVVQAERDKLARLEAELGALEDGR